jgi:hypothetical protein
MLPYKYSEGYGGRIEHFQKKWVPLLRCEKATQKYAFSEKVAPTFAGRKSDTRNTHFLHIENRAHQHSNKKAVMNNHSEGTLWFITAFCQM